MFSFIRMVIIILKFFFFFFNESITKIYPINIILKQITKLKLKFYSKTILIYFPKNENKIL